VLKRRRRRKNGGEKKREKRNRYYRINDRKNRKKRNTATVEHILYLSSCNKERKTRRVIQKEFENYID